MLSFQRLSYSYFQTLIFIVLLSPTMSHAQSENKSDKAMNALNNYVLFVNQNISTLTFFHKKFERFNLKLNHYYQTAPRDSLSRVKDLEAGNRLIFSEGSDAVSLSSLYETTVSPKAPLIRQQKKLNTLSDQLMKLIYQLLDINKKLEAHIENKRYLADPTLVFCYRELNAVRLLYHDFAIVKEKLEQELRIAAQPYQSNSTVETAFSYWQNQILPTSRSLLYTIKKDVPKEGDERIQDLSTSIGQVKKQQKLLKPLKTSNRSTFKVLHHAFDKMEASSEKLIEAAYTFTQKEMNSAEAQLLGNSYVIFNQQALPSYNQFIEELNHTNQLTGVMRLFAMKEVPWFKYLLPQTDDSKPANVSKLAGAVPNHLVFLLDVSGSMNATNKLPLLQQSLKYLISQMRPFDLISIVVYSGKAKVVLPPTSPENSKKIIRVINGLKSNGQSNALLGLRLAYDLLDQNFIKGGNNKVIMATDGDFSSNNLLYQLISQQAFHEKKLSLLFFGSKLARFQAKLKDLSKRGKGNYVHITPENAKEALIKEARQKML